MHIYMQIIHYSSATLYKPKCVCVWCAKRGSKFNYENFGINCLNTYSQCTALRQATYSTTLHFSLNGLKKWDITLQHTRLKHSEFFCNNCCVYYTCFNIKKTLYWLYSTLFCKKKVALPKLVYVCWCEAVSPKLLLDSKLCLVNINAPLPLFLHTVIPNKSLDHTAHGRHQPNALLYCSCFDISNVVYFCAQMYKRYSSSKQQWFEVTSPKGNHCQF